uniref:polysaccharide pyruvyl transferase family protein n=1 Tax=Microbulbifer agarilyticus TaxID=260552 RepID=UPI0002557F43|nr:polysaccharide pyruvyl transferase family protein [Microbulbifer agarilyticus]
MKKYFISLRTQFPNLGDLLINRALLEELMANGDVYMDTTGVPKWYLEIMLSSLPCETLKKKTTLTYYLGLFSSLWVKFTNRESLVFLVMKPGGYPATTSWRIGIRRVLQGLALHSFRSLGIRIVRAPSSQKNSNGIFWLIDKFRLSSVDCSLIRDVNSEREMRRMGVSYLSSDDLAIIFFALPQHSLFKRPFLEHQAKEVVTISLRKPRRNGEQLAYSKLAALITRQGPEVNFVSQVFYDDRINSEVACKNGADILVYDGTLDSIDAITKQYQNSEFVISNRLHVLLLAFLNGAIPIAVVGEDDSKIEGCFHKLDLEGNVFNWSDVNEINLSQVRAKWDVEKYNLIVEKSSFLKKQLAEVFSG